jgi:hypothetical protein
MRSVRVRFTRPKQVRDQSRAAKSRLGVTQFRNNSQGRIAKFELLADTRSKQGGLCSKCNGPMELSESRFENDKFTEGVEIRAVHKRCPCPADRQQP